MLVPQLKVDLENPFAAERTLRDAIEVGGRLKDPGLIDALYRRGRVRREEHKFREALLDFRCALSGMPIFLQGHLESPPYLNRANIYLETARVHVLEERHDLAWCALDLAEQEANALSDYDCWADIHLERARLLIADNALEEGELELGRALEALDSSVLDADLASVYLELGIIRAYQGELEAAMACFDVAASDLTRDSVAWLRLQLATGDVLWLRGQLMSALWHYQHARNVLESRAREREGEPGFAKLAARVNERLADGRLHLRTLYGALLEELFDAVIDHDGDRVLASTGELAVLALVFDDYERIAELVHSTCCELASAALAYHMIQLSNSLDDDLEDFEHDFDVSTEALAGWELEVARRTF